MNFLVYFDPLLYTVVAFHGFVFTNRIDSSMHFQTATTGMVKTIEELPQVPQHVCRG